MRTTPVSYSPAQEWSDPRLEGSSQGDTEWCPQMVDIEPGPGLASVFEIWEEGPGEGDPTCL